MGLSIRDLSIYLPYGLRYYDEALGLVIGVFSGGWDYADNIENADHLTNLLKYKGYKPILRPLEDLGSYVLPGRGYTGYDCFTDGQWSSFIEGGMPLINVLEYIEVEILAEAHFDVFGLIPRGLAISIHDVKEHSKDTKKY